MSNARLVEDRLRSDYVALLPSLQRMLTQIETELRYALLPLTLRLNRYERILVRARVKDCESAVDALRRRQEGGTFDTEQAARYSLTSLPDLVGIRVLTFPQRQFQAVRELLSSRTNEWKADPLPGTAPDDPPIALKYHGFWTRNDPVEAEIQVVSLLVGLFWEVEHSAIYKPSPDLRGIEKSRAMKGKTSAVFAALRDFEQEFDRQVDNADTSDDD